MERRPLRGWCSREKERGSEGTEVAVGLGYWVLVGMAVCVCVRGKRRVKGVGGGCQPLVQVRGE